MNAHITLADLTACPQWVAWRNEQRGADITKVPYTAANRLAEADNPETWMPHDQAVLVSAAIVNGAGGGVGIELGRCGDRWLLGIDLDTCREPLSGQIDPWALEIIDRLASYAEISPSGTGVKVFMLTDPADVPELRRIMGTQHGRQFKRANGGAHPPAIELYTSNRYFAVTWQACDDAPNELRPVPLGDLRWLIEEAGPAFAGKAKPKGSSGSDDTILARLNRLAAHNKAVDAALRNAATMKGGSRSEGALGLGGALKRAGWSYQDMKDALLACPATRDWATEKQAEGERQFERIWQEAREREDEQRASDWPEPVDFFSARNSQPPQLQERHVPPSLWPFIADTAERMGAATSSVALAAIVACASAIHEDWQIQPKRHDFTWTEHARLWGAIVGPPGIMKSPIIAATTAPIVALDVAAHKEWAEQMTLHRAALANWKTGNKNEPEPKPPRKARHLVENATVEALQEVLRDDAEGKLYAPLGKVLVRQDELAEFLASMDKYSTSKGTDRGAYLRAYNGGRFSIDRIGRGSFVTNSWSACLLGGIQPEPIQRFATKTVDDGLMQRMMLDVPGRQGDGEDRAPNHAANRMYRDIFPVLAALRPAKSLDTGYPIAVALHRDGHEAREDINALARVMDAMPDASPRLQSTFDKWPGLFARLCLVFHLVEIAAAKVRGEIGPPIGVVPAEIADRVRRYMRGILTPNLWRAELIIFDTRQTDHATWIAGFILAQRLDRIAARDIVQSYRALRSPEERDTLNSTMDSLCVFGWLAPAVQRNDTRPPVTWLVNPAVHGSFAEQAAAERDRRGAIKESIARHVAALRENDGVDNVA